MATAPRSTCANPRCGRPLPEDSKSGFCSKQCQRNHERHQYRPADAARPSHPALPRQIEPHHKRNGKDRRE